MRTVIAFLLTALSLEVSATIEGIFWDPTFDGEGWAIEAQNDLAFFTWYRYEDDGEPTFRTALCSYTYEATSLTDMEVSCSGRLTLTRNRSENSDAGPFSAVFRWEQGRLVGDINAGGALRTLVPFSFNFRNDADFLHGIWVVAEIGTEETDSDTVLFSSEETVLDDGVTPARAFTTLDSGGAPGFAYFDDEEEALVAVQDLGNLRGVARFQSTDDKALGVVFDTDAAGNIISELTVVLAASVLNTEGEQEALGGFLEALAAKSSPARPLAIPMSRVPRHTFAQMRARLAVQRRAQPR